MQITTAVAEVGDEHFRAVPPEREHDGGAHVAQIAVEGAHRDDFFVGLDDGLANNTLGLVGRGVGGEVLADLARHHFDGTLTGNLPGRLTSHAVGHDAQRRVGEDLDVDGILVVLAVIAEQRTFADIQRERHEPPWVVICQLEVKDQNETNWQSLSSSQL